MVETKAISSAKKSATLYRVRHLIAVHLLRSGLCLVHVNKRSQEATWGCLIPLTLVFLSKTFSSNRASSVKCKSISFVTFGHLSKYCTTPSILEYSSFSTEQTFEPERCFLRCIISLETEFCLDVWMTSSDVFSQSRYFWIILAFLLQCVF